MRADKKDKTMATPNYIQRNNTSWFKRATAYIATFALCYQPLVPAIGAVLNDAYIQDQLNSYASFERSTSSSYQFEGAPYINATAPAAMHIDAFFSALEKNHRHVLGEAKQIPISVGDITTFIPTYTRPKLVGTPLVQSRYIRSQVQHTLGRHLIDVSNNGYKTEAAQINTLYQNALNYINIKPGVRYGDVLGLDTNNTGLPYDIVWPEFRQINGEQVVVPIVYLSNSTIAQQKITSNVTELYGNVTLDSLTIDQVDVKFGRDTFLNVANDLLNNQGTIEGEGELQIVAGGRLTNLSGVIQAQGDLRIGAHGITNQTILYRYDQINNGTREQGTRYGAVASIDSISEGSLTLRSYEDIVFLGAQASAGGSLTLAADGNILLASQPIQETANRYRYNESSVSYLQSGLTAEETIQLIANGQITIDAAEIVSDNGHIEILAGMGVTIEDDLSQYQSLQTWRKGHESVYKTVAMRSLLDAGKGLKIHSEFGDITLKAADITTTEGTSVKAANGGVNLLMTVENDHYSYANQKSGLFTTRTINKGHQIETGVPNSIVGGLVVESANGLTVEYEGDASFSMDEQIAELSQFEGLEWMADIRSNPELQNVDWNAIELQYETWKIDKTSLSPAFAAVISIAIAIYTGGVGASFAASITGGSAASLGVVGTAIAAGTTALISQSALALANGIVDGDIAGAMEQLASDETLRSLAVAMVTAGAMQAIDAQFFELTDGATELGLTQQAAQAVTHATVQAGVQNIAYGADFDDVFVQSLTQNGINHLGEYMAGEIKGAFDHPGAGSLDTALKYISHAGAGCILGAASASNNGSDSDAGCAAGAGGAVIGELVGDVYRSNSQAVQDAQKVEGFLDRYGLTDPSQLSETQIQELQSLVGSSNNLASAAADLSRLHQQGINLAKLSAALGAFVAGADANQINTAAMTGQNAAENNALFLIPVAIFLLKAADVAITVYELNELRKDIDAAGDDEAKREAALKKYFGDKVEDAALDVVVEQALKKIIPGTTVIDKILDVAKERGIVSDNNVDKIKDALSDRKDSEIDTPSQEMLDDRSHPDWANYNNATGDLGYSLGNPTDDMASFRRDLNLPPAGSVADNSTIAVMDVNGRQIYGINAHGQPVSNVNAISKTHAEIDALNQIGQQGIDVRGQDLVLYVDRDPCRACGQNGGIRSMVTQLDINSLTVIGPSGPIVIKP